MPLKAFVLDDEPPALRRLVRMLAETERVDIVGQATDPEVAIEEIRRAAPDVLFLDIQMPRLSGFEVVQQLDPQPIVVFTTAYDEYALRAFEVNSIDYLLKPIDAERLESALDKIEHLRGTAAPPDVRDLVQQLARAYRTDKRLARLPSRIGDRTTFVEVADVTHIYAHDKLTYAATAARDFPLDLTIAELERQLEPDGFVRIHRAALVNLKFVQELDAWSGGGGMVRLKNAKRTELQVARDRVRALKERLGLQR